MNTSTIATRLGLCLAVLASSLVVLTSAAGAQADEEFGLVQARYVSAYELATTLEELQFAPDFTAQHANVLRLYQAFFNRVPDLEGAKYWVQQWDVVQAEGPTPARPDGHDLLGEFANYFTQVPEFINTYGNPDNETFLTTVYRNMLDRDPDPAGYNYWLSFLNGDNAEQPGIVLDKGATMRWVTQNDEFVGQYPFGHIDRSAHPSEFADCSEENLRAFRFQEITGIYRLRNGEIRELCFGTRDVVIENAWTRMVQVSDPAHHSPVALLAVYKGNGGGILAYAGPSTSNGTFGPDVWRIGAQDVHFASSEERADLTMTHEMSHVFTQLADQIDQTTQNPNTTTNGVPLPPNCGTSVTAFNRYCFRSDAIIIQWVQTFWAPSELAIWETLIDGDLTNNVNPTTLCVPGHDFSGSYATTSPYEDLADAFTAYVHGLDKPNLAAKYAFFEARPTLRAYKERAIAAGQYGYEDIFDDCFAPTSG